MKPAPFELQRPTSVAEALEVLAGSDGDVKPLAGGQSLVPLLSMRLATPAVLVDLNRLDDLTGVDALPSGRVRFGAMTRQCALVLAIDHPLVAEAARWIGHTAIRTRGTIGGSLAHADPSAELPCVAVACDATMTVRSVAGERLVAADEFFRSTFETAVGDDELLTAADLAVPRRWGFHELARRDGDFALVLAVVAELDDGWRVVIGGIGSTPQRCTEAEAVLATGDGTERTADEVATAVADTVVAFDDVHASARYREAMAAHVAGQATAAALGGAR